MTPLRFRAWYHHKGNSDNGWMEYLSFGIDETYQDKFLLAKEQGFIGMKVFSQLEGFKHERDFALMQSTGLKDKNGKEIFEGDIVRVSAPTDEGSYVIEWGNCQWWYNANKQHYYRVEASMTEFSEVIGNRYENPDLLPQP